MSDAAMSVPSITIGRVEEKGSKHSVDESNLDAYFVPSERVNRAQTFIKSAEYYVFRKVQVASR